VNGLSFALYGVVSEEVEGLDEDEEELDELEELDEDEFEDEDGFGLKEVVSVVFSFDFVSGAGGLLLSSDVVV
jgi:hypothetical protein